LLEGPLTRYQSILNRLLAKDRTDRFASAGELLACVRQLQAEG
jgi:hypothetical protein